MNVNSQTLLALLTVDQLSALVRPGTTRADIRYVLASALAALDERGLNPTIKDEFQNSDAFMASLQSLLDDASDSSDALLGTQWSVLNEDTLVNQDNWFAASAANFVDTHTNTDALGAAWTFPAWLDALTTTDATHVAVLLSQSDAVSTTDFYAVSVGMPSTDAFIATEVISGWSQSYSLDVTYFAGDYATTQFL